MAAAISSRSSSVELERAGRDPAVDLSGERAPTIAPVTPSQASVQATATAPTPTPCRRATGTSASRSEVELEQRRAELLVLAAPVVVGESGDALGGEGTRSAGRTASGCRRSRRC
jgi:hypothetical protein